MTRRPDPFSQPKLEETLQAIGCPESFISTTISNYRLFVPLLFAELGEERVFELVDKSREPLGLGEQESAWRSSVKYLVAWAEYTLEQYQARRAHLPPESADRDQQPRLF